MKISHRGIPKYLTGKNLWYDGIIDFDPTKYVSNYDYERGLVAGDLSNHTIRPAWASRTAGLDPGRYVPTNLTNYGNFGEHQSHWNYAQSVEDLEYYQLHTKDLFNPDGSLSEMGRKWIEDTDKLLPEGHSARILNPDGTIKDKITVTLKDAHNRTPLVRTFNLKNPEELKAYVEHVRLDLTIGGRHNIYLKRGKRYFYTDKEGNRHWVNPEDVSKYTVSKDPVESGWEGETYWDDYELTGPSTEGGPTVERPSGPISEGVKIPDEIETGEEDGNKTPVGHRLFGVDWNKVGEGFRKIFNNPEIYSLGRLALNIAANDKIYGEQLKGIKPVLKDPYLTHRLVVGDEATKLAYYRRAAQGQTKAARPFTSDADRQMAYLMEAKRVGDELRALGDLADNQEIRRTSDESNQHQWANTQRATEVANYNIASINQANSLKHNLKAQWRAANASSVDNALKEIQYKIMKRLAEEEALGDLIFTLLQLLNLLTDPKILEARKKYQSVLDKHKLSDNTYDWTNDEVILAQRDYQAVQLQLAIENKEKWRDYKNKGIFFVKNGSKITRKVKDDMLYMSTRDVVKHFREMTKLSSDALNRKQPKIERLTSHPKGSTRRYLLGGVAPFLVYTPITLGGETTTSSESSTSSTKASSKDTSAKDSLDFVKELFKELAGKGLLVDVNTIYSQFNNMFLKAKAFGEDISTEDIQLMYLSAISKVNEILRSKDIYDKAKSYATTNDALNEYAVTADGSYVVLDKTGKVSFVSKLSDITKDKVPITNQQLLYLREYSPLLLLENGNFIVENVINNGMGINKIGAAIKALAGNISSNTQKIEGLSEIESKKVKAGLLLLALTDGTPDGVYKVTNETHDSKVLVDAAIKYIENMLSPSLRAILDIHGGTRPLIESFLSSLTGTTISQSISPLTGKASDSSKSKSGSDDITPAVALAMGLGERQSVIILDKTLDGLKIDVVSLPLLDSSHNAMANATLYLVGNGDYAGLLDLGLVTMGGIKIDPSAINDVLIERGRIYSAELPIDKQAAANGIYKPNLDFLKNIEKADAQIKERGITNRDNLTSEEILIINKIYLDNQLPIIYTTDSDGKAVLTPDYRRFAIMHATAPESVFLEDPNFNDGVIEASEEDRNRFESMMKEVTKNDKYKFDSGISIFGQRITGPELYKGLLYIPMGTSTISALSSTGYKASPETYNQIEAADLQAEFIRSSGYKSAGNWK